MQDLGHLNKNASRYLTPISPRTARFYYLLKIHKPTLPNGTVPSRSIISSCSALTEHISEFVDHHLQHLVLKIPSYLKDTTDFFNKLNTLNTLPPGS